MNLPTTPGAAGSAVKNGLFRLQIGPVNIRLLSPIDAVARHIRFHYAHFPVLDDDSFIDFNLQVASPSLLRRYFRPQASFSIDGQSPFAPFPLGQAAALFEWGLNWCLAQYCHRFLLIHAGVVERNGQAFVFPGVPGSGKSTLCAALVGTGWRLLSDEMALLDPETGLAYPMPRPISLKNASIALIAAFCPEQAIGPIIHDTHKGVLSHMRPPATSVDLLRQPATVRRVIFPKYAAQSATVLSPLSKGRALMRLADNSFNYHILGQRGFGCLAKICDTSDCHDFQYSRLEEAVTLFSELTA